MGGFRHAMREGLGDWITWGMYCLGATQTTLASIASIKGYESLDLWLGAGVLALTSLSYNYVSGVTRFKSKQENANKNKSYQI